MPKYQAKKRKKEDASTSSGKLLKCQALEFSNLPVECKIHIFKFLADVDKCRASQVCHLWAELLKTSILWPIADFTQVLCCIDGDLRSMNSLGCSNIYPYVDIMIPGIKPGVNSSCCNRLKERVDCYLKYLATRKAFLKCLKFEFDIQEGDYIWLEAIVGCLKKTKCQNLKQVICRWAFTPHLQMWNHNYKVQSKHERVFAFHRLLETMSETSPGIEHFRIQFDWSLPSVLHLCKFKNVHTLELSKYWVFVRTPQGSIDALLEGLPKLRVIRLEVVIPFQEGTSHMLYNLCSASLEEVDIRKCAGFFLSSVTLPKLTSFSAHREYWTGPVLSRAVLKIPCLHSILRDGAPSMKFYNGYLVPKGWKKDTGAVMEEELKSSCYCPKHKRGDFFY